MSEKNLKEALRRVKANKGSAGVDGMTVGQITDYLKQHWPKSVSMETTMEELAPYMRGWRGYFGFCECTSRGRRRMRRRALVLAASKSVTMICRPQ